jgi:hypothetical protein
LIASILAFATADAARCCAARAHHPASPRSSRTRIPSRGHYGSRRRPHGAGASARSRRVPRQPLDPCHNLPKERPRQVVFGEPQGKRSVPDQCPPLLETRERPAPDGGGQHPPTQQVAEVIGDDTEEPPHLVGPKPMAGGPVDRGYFSSPLSRTTSAMNEMTTAANASGARPGARWRWPGIFLRIARGSACSILSKPSR